MKHEEVVTALKTVAENPKATGISKDDLQDLKKYNLIDIDSTEKVPVYSLTKKGRVMLKANSKKPDDV
jgi:predicted transcriptional regulator